MINHLWQSTVFAILAAILTLAFRRNRAQVRYWLWLSASIKFLIPFSLLISLGSYVQWAPVVQTIATPAVSSTVVQFTQPFPETAAIVPSTAGTPDWIPLVILGVWVCGFAAIALIRLRGWLRIRAAVRSSVPVNFAAAVEVRSSPGLLEPGVVGFLRPILLLPEGIAESLTPRQLEAVLAHELCHVRRRDNLTSAIHMIVEAVFWFHPLVWWIGARLVEERERACDEAVLSLGNEPQVYAEGILNVCKIYVESPLRCVSGVTGSDLKKRIQAILTGRVAGELNFARRVALAVAGIAALALPVIVGMIHAQSQPAAVRPKFEVASIRRCDEGAGPNERGVGGTSSPGRLTLTCQSVSGLIDAAYVIFANGVDAEDPGLVSNTPVEGGPGWISSERYTINAKAESNASDEMMQGPMLQSLLEDRFKLKIRRESREVPVYALTPAKGGPKLQPFKEGTCVEEVITFPRTPPPAGQRYCERGGRPGGPNRVLVQEGITLDELCKTFLGGPVAGLGRRVIDRTGLTGKFNIHLEFAPTQEALARLRAKGKDNGEPTAPSLADALEEQLGLKLESTKGRGEFYVIDHIERPSEN